LLPTHANGQPAFVLYTLANGQHEWRAHSVQVLGLGEDGVASLTAFMRPTALELVPAFGLPLAIDEPAPSCEHRSYRGFLNLAGGLALD
jgi:hypothetical protein